MDNEIEQDQHVENRNVLDSNITTRRYILAYTHDLDMIDMLGPARRVPHLGPQGGRALAGDLSAPPHPGPSKIEYAPLRGTVIHKAATRPRAQRQGSAVDGRDHRPGAGGRRLRWGSYGAWSSATAHARLREAPLRRGERTLGAKYSREWELKRADLPDQVDDEVTLCTEPSCLDFGAFHSAPHMTVHIISGSGNARPSFRLEES